jgi:hypothetical protein
VRLALATALVVLLVAPSTTAATPVLRVIDQSPLVVRGTGFKPRERIRVRLTLTSSSRYRDVVAGSAGGFSVRFIITPLQCTQARSVTAAGNRGSRATRPLGLDCESPPLS